MKLLLLSTVLAVLATAAEAGAQLYRVEPSRNSRRSLQPQKPGRDKPRTQVSIEIDTGKQGVGLQVVRWRPVFDRLGIPVSIRSGGLGEPETSEKTVGTLRRVTVSGRMERNGKLVFADRSFSTDEAEKLKAWIEELQTYGAQGAPEGQPVWGLDQTQFETLFAALSQPLDAEIAGLPLPAAVAKFAIGDAYPVVYADKNGRPRAGDTLPAATVRSELEGIAKGTALAVLLADHGLAYRPQRTPGGSIQIEVVPRESEGKYWPIGWEPKSPNLKTAPKLFTLIPIELENVKLVDVAAAVANQSGVAVRFDRHRMEEKKIDLENVTISFPSRNATYSKLLQTAAAQLQMKSSLRIDEVGQPFVWISPIDYERYRR